MPELSPILAVFISYGVGMVANDCADALIDGKDKDSSSSTKKQTSDCKWTHREETRMDLCRKLVVAITPGRLSWSLEPIWALVRVQSWFDGTFRPWIAETIASEESFGRVALHFTTVGSDHPGHSNAPCGSWTTNR
mmetsp:Transcript_25565/g.42523  ORF Transcript_25565/g.42523 Transcript_25565/m.42523 type:complete len:136 (+) Transcript_25565:401-808(+)